MNYEFKDIQRKVICSINKLRESDSFLLEEDVNERSITHKLAEYLQQEFKEWDVDCEYNRMWKDDSNISKSMNFLVENIKSDDTEAKTIYPDIIIHKRGRRQNLLVIEVKKLKNNSNLELDMQKLENFTSNQYNDFNYYYGLRLLFHVGKNDFKQLPECTWYKEGKIMEEFENAS